MRHWSDGDRIVWDEMQRDAAPSVDFLKDRQHTARQPWKCQTCGKERPAGTVYRSTAGKIDGEFFTEKTCVMTPNGECPYNMTKWLVTFVRDLDDRPPGAGDPRSWLPSFTKVIKAENQGDARHYAEPFADSTPPYNFKIKSIEPAPDDAPVDL